jgi:hypothetical protein
MWHATWGISLAIIAAGLLNGCGRPDAYAVAPEFLRQPRAEPRLPEPEPDVASLLQANSVFPQSSHPKDVMITKPRRDPTSQGWTFCIKANVSGINGSSIGVQTYLVYIEQGKVGQRRLATPSDGCQSESYQRL